MTVRPLAWFGCAAGICCLLLMATGCGGPGYGSPVAVSGKITVDDAPLANALVTYHCTEGREPQFKSFMTTTGTDGTYRFEEVYPGPYEISVAEVEANVDPGEASAMAAQALQPVAGELTTVVGNEDLTFDIQLKRSNSRR